MILQKIINYIFPKTCAICQKIWDWLCLDCKKKLQTHPDICLYCHQNSPNFETCRFCKTKWSMLNGCIICFSYNIYIKKLIIKLKYQHRQSTKTLLGQQLFFSLMSNTYRSDKVSKNQKIYLTFVPSHRRRKYFVKWYNQSQLLAQEIATLWNFEILDLVKKTKNTKSQVNLNKLERHKNLIWVFAKKDKIDIWENDNIIIIDDITTTGSTLNEIAKTIRQTYPNINIWWMVLARNNQ